MKKAVMFIVFVVLLSSMVYAGGTPLSQTPQIDIISIPTEYLTGLSCGVYDINQCPSNGVPIMYLNQMDNAHGYKEEGSATTKVLCCSGGEVGKSCWSYNLNTNKIDNNELLWLNQKNNAHAAKTKSGLYTEPVCISGVNCTWTNSKPSGYTFVIGLNQDYNAHLYGSPEGYAESSKQNLYCKLKIVIPPENCTNNIDDDKDKKKDCYDEDCWDKKECKGKTCQTDKVVVWSYILPAWQTLLDNNTAPINAYVPLYAAVNCCEKTECSWYSCFSQGTATPDYLSVCSKDNNWLTCTQDIEGQISDSNNYRCNGYYWEPYENICSDKQDNDADGNADCLDSDCNYKVCGDKSTCINNVCVKKEEAGFAPGQIEVKKAVSKYEDIFNNLFGNCQYIDSSGNCKDVCTGMGKKSFFGIGFGGGKCTCC
ncbi:MAG: hypothetical protein ABH824_07530 [Nanoarchaeota archaeon]|nr:hypothetical protein [Nanoarchaeota archaeon]